VLAAIPAAGQATDGQGGTGPGRADRPTQATSTTGAAATTDETKLLIPDTTGGAAGGGPAAGGTTPVRAPGVSGWDYVRMLLILALVVGLIYGVFWLLRRGQRLKTPENEMIRVLGSRGLGGNRALHLVEVGRSVYLVGAADNSVNLVAEVRDQETIDALRVQAAEEGGKVRRSFAATLARVFSPPKGPDRGGSGGAAGLGEGADFLRRNRERLRRLGGGR
jgi:flagellar protein FliO/FliZ